MGKLFLPSELSPRERYSLLTQSLVPRPIAVVATRATNDSINLAPYSFFAGVSANPPTLAFSASSRRDGMLKDTPTNIFRTKSFVVHIMSERYVDAIAQCGEDFPYGESELEKVGFHTLPCSLLNDTLRVEEADIAFECTLFDSLTIASQEAPYRDLPPTTLIVGKIEAIHIDEALLQDEHTVDYQAFRPLARLGGSLYTTLGPVINVPTPRRQGIERSS